MKKRIKSLTNLSMKVKFIDGCTAVQIMVVNNITDETFIRIVPLDFNVKEDEDQDEAEESENDSKEVVTND